MKKKIVALCLVLALALTAIGGATLAYFTDTEDEINVFTLGNVVIDLVEEQRKEDGSGLEEFVDGKVLLPIVGSAQGEKVNVGGYNLPTAKNWVDKIVTVDNEGTQDAYVRVLFAFPAKMDDAQSAAEMMMHWNHDAAMPATGVWTHKDCGVKVTLDGEVYNVYNYTYEKVLAKKGENGATTEYPAITGVYIDKRVNATVNAEGDITYSMVNGRGNTVSATYAKGTAPKLYVLTQGVQEAGFANANEALVAGFGEVTEANAQAWFDAVATGDRADIG